MNQSAKPWVYQYLDPAFRTICGFVSKKCIEDKSATLTVNGLTSSEYQQKCALFLIHITSNYRYRVNFSVYLEIPEICIYIYKHH